MGGSQGDTDTVLRAHSRQKSPPTSDDQRNTSRHTPRNISSVKRLILPVGRIRFLIHSEGFSRQSLDVLKPNTVTSSVRGGIISLTVGQRRVKKEKGVAFRNPQLHTSRLRSVNVKHVRALTASRTPPADDVCPPKRRGRAPALESALKYKVKTVLSDTLPKREVN